MSDVYQDGLTTFPLDTRTMRERAVDQLTEHFIRRGVREPTARAWAEAETPSYTFVLNNCRFYGNMPEPQQRQSHYSSGEQDSITKEPK